MSIRKVRESAAMMVFVSSSWSSIILFWFFGFSEHSLVGSTIECCCSPSLLLMEMTHVTCDRSRYLKWLILSVEPFYLTVYRALKVSSSLRYKLPRKNEILATTILARPTRPLAYRIYDTILSLESTLPNYVQNNRKCP